MVEFNPDGSLKLPNSMIKKQQDDDKLFEETPCIRVIRNQISSITPLKCELKIQASKKLKNPDIENKFKQATGKFRHKAQLTINKDNDEYIVTIISGQYHCDWCNNFRKFLGKNTINWGSCFEYTGSRPD